MLKELNNKKDEFEFNFIDDNYIQIYGSVNGFAIKKIVNNQECWDFDIQFFKGSSLIKVNSNEKDGTIWNIEKLKNRIKKAYNN